MRNILRCILPVLLLFSGGVASLAQSVNAGDIRGTVTDSTGALIPDATVTVLDVDTGVSKNFTTNHDGVYDTSSIVTGSYNVTFSKGGFQTLIRGPITLEVGFTTVNAQLKVGSQTVEITVNTDVPLLSTESGDQTVTLESKEMEQLPQVGQDWENFMILMPGATGAPGGDQGASNPGQAVSVNGSLPYNNIIADGASTTLSHSQNANPAIFQDVDELQVSLSSFSAQYGVGGAIINQISKGGTSHFHGSGYDFLQNDAFNAANFGFASQPTVPFLRYNDFGGNVGGPVLIPGLKGIKKKAFFFFGYDQIVDHGSASNATNSIPSAAVMTGDFSGELPIYDPTTQTIAYDPKGNPYPVRQSFQSENGSNAIPSSLQDTVATKFQQFYPTASNHIAGGKFIPGSVGSDGEVQNNFYSTIPQSTPYRKYFGRLDYDITPNNRLTMSDTQSDTPVIYPNSVTACPIGCQAGDVDNNNAQVTDVWNISPRTINEARMGYTWQGNFFGDLALNKGYPAELGWQFAKADDFPAIQFYRNYPYAWIQPSTNAVYKEHVFDPSDVVTMIRGKHIIHFGGEMLIYRDDSTAWGNTNAGTLQFGGAYTEEWDHAACGSSAYAGQMCPDTTTGLEYADFLLGYSNSWGASLSPEYGARFKSPQVFFQDDYKIRPNLTINLGIRYQINHGWNEVTNNEASFDPKVVNPGTYSTPNGNVTNPLGAYWFGTTGANSRKALIADVYDTVLPRVGFSWLIHSNTTVRGAYGIYSYNWSLDNYGGNNSSYGMGAARSNSGNDSDQTNGITPVVKLDGTGNVFGTSTALPYSEASNSPTAYNGQAVGYVAYHVPVPKMSQWNVSVQQELTPNFMMQLAYVGSHGSNLIFSTDLNVVPEQYLSSNDSTYRPYPWYQNISGSTNNGVSNYNSLQVSLTKRMTHGFSFSMNYVWSHMLDDMDSSGWGSREGPQTWQNTNPAINYSNSNFDVRDAFKGYAVYTLPFGKGQQFLNHSSLLDEVIGGWQISGTVQEMTGQPFTLTTSQNTYQLDGSSFPNRNPGVSWKPAHQSARCEQSNSGGCVNEWYNPSAFTEPANGTFGNVRRNSLYGPGINEVNLSGGKTFSIYENMKFQFRVDATNAFNHASFGSPNGGLSGAEGVGLAYPFGENAAGTGSNTTQQITGLTVGGRSVQFGGKLTF
jgi:hypothetical protein